MREKTKKQQTTKYLICLLAILMLALIAITGAWFTDTQTGEEVKVNFGEIKIELGEGSTAIVLNADNEAVTRDIMPDDTLRVSMLVGKAADTEDFYWKAKATVTIADTTTTLDSGWSTETYNTKEDTSAVTIDFKLDGDTYGNEFENKEVTIGYEIRAIQMANLTEAQAGNAITSNAADVFASGENLSFEAGNGNEDETLPASEGLRFSSYYINDNNGYYYADRVDDVNSETCVWVDMGTCRDTEIVVPEKDPLGRTVVGVTHAEENRGWYGVAWYRTNGYFYENNYVPVTSVILPKTVTFIGCGAFSLCKDLAYIEMPSVTCLDCQAFYGCSSLETIEIPSSVTSIRDACFLNCGLKTVYYRGTASEFANMTIDYGNDIFVNTTRYYYSPDAQNAEGNGWRYVEGIPTAW